MPKLEVLNSVLATIQDMGRYGYRSLGVPVSGALDRSSAVQANVLVSNPPGAPLIESFGPIMLRALSDSIVAVTGALARIAIDGRAAAEYRPLWLPKGSVLEVGPPILGQVIYVAVAGRISCDEVMGSCSTYTRGGFGGLGGRPLRPGDVIEASLGGQGLEDLWSSISTRYVPEEGRVVYRLRQGVVLRVTPGPHRGVLGDDDWGRLLSETYTVAPESDRMGFRLRGPPLESAKRLGRLPSFPVDRGFVQVPPAGTPIVLMADAQTTGGYAVVAVVVPPDTDLLAQCPPGTPVRFAELGVDEAEDVTAQYLSYLESPEVSEVGPGFSEYDAYV